MGVRRTCTRRWRRRATERTVRKLLRADDLEGLAGLLNDAVGTKIVESDEDGIRMVEDRPTSDLQLFRHLAREDPAAALELVRGPPLTGIDAPWAEEARKEIQAEIVATAHSACRLDPSHAAEYLRKGLTGAPADTSLWISLFDLAARAESREALQMAYGWAEKTYATGGDGTVPEVVTRAYERRYAELL